MQNKPNLFVIGAPKSGTTGFVASIKNHPEVFVPELKEPRFFDAHTFFDFNEDYPITTIEQYLELYKSSDAENCQYRVDGSVFNMYSPESINNILKLSPDAKFILILRDPLSATKSMFSQRMKYIDPAFREVSESFDECWELMKERKNGHNFPKNCRNKFIFRYDLLYSYEKYIPYINELINTKNLHISSYSEFRGNPALFFKKIYVFLGIENIPLLENKVRNKSFHVKRTLKVRVVSFLISKTFYLRRKINTKGFLFRNFKSFLLDNRKEAPVTSKKSDADIKKYFKPTYDYLKSQDIKP